VNGDQAEVTCESIKRQDLLACATVWQLNFHCLYSMRSRVYVTVWCPSVRLSGCPICPFISALDCRSVRPCKGKGKGSPYSVAERRVPELIPVLGSQPAGDVSHKPGGRLAVITSREPAVTPATLKRAATNFAAW